jgi:hypothetical protein
MRKRYGLYVALAAIAFAASAWAVNVHATAATAEPTKTDATAHSSAGPVDSIFPMPELLRRFRSGLEPVSSLANGAPSLDELVASFIAAVERSDTAELARLTLTRAEYAFAYFSHSAYMHEPYELPPEIAWMLGTAASEKGVGRVMRLLGGQRLEYRGYRCERESAEGPNRFWRDCLADYLHPREGRVSRRLFGTIIEHRGRYKFLTYANDF